MAMKETVSSIKAYFGLMGVFGTIGGISGIFFSTLELDAMEITGAVFHLFLGLGFMYSSYKFQELVKTSTRFVQNLLVITGIFSLIHVIFSVILQVYDYRLIPPLLGVIIVWYLYLNVKRLGEEHGLEDFENS